MASQAADAFGEMGAQQKQKQAYDDWMRQQDANRAAENAKEQANTAIATGALNQTIRQVGGPAQQAQLTAEQARLSALLQGRDPLTGSTMPAGGTVSSKYGVPAPSTGNAAAPALSDQPAATSNKPIDTSQFQLSGQAQGDPQFQADLAAKINAASQVARSRMAALANLGAYGGSSGGLDRYTTDIFQRSGNVIDRINDFDRGNLAVYNTEQNVNPIQYSYTPSPITGILKSFGSVKL